MAKSEQEPAGGVEKEWEAEPASGGWRRREWLTKREAARFLGVSERQIERHAARGRLRVQHQKREAHQRAARVMFMREDLEAIARDQPNNYRSDVPEVSQGGAKLPAMPNLAAIARLFQMLSPALPVAPAASLPA